MGVPSVRLELGLQKTYRWIYDQIAKASTERSSAQLAPPAQT
jgi:hypothetical protein